MEGGRDKHVASTWKRKLIDIQQAVEVKRDEQASSRVEMGNHEHEAAM